MQNCNYVTVEIKKKKEKKRKIKIKIKETPEAILAEQNLSTHLPWPQHRSLLVSASSEIPRRKKKKKKLMGH